MTSRSLPPLPGAVLLALSLLPGVAAALPDAGKQQRIGDLVVWNDSADRRLFYYAPGDLRVAVREDGGPDADFFAVRYLGSTLTGDSGTFFVRSRFSTAVKLTPPRAGALSEAGAQLRRTLGAAVRILPLPIQRIDVTLTYAATDRSGPGATAFSDGFLDPGAAETAGTFWRERMYTVYLGKVDAQILLAALRAGATLMSVSYQMHVRAVDSVAQPSSHEPADVVAAASAVPFTLDVGRFPDRLHLIDLADTAPPGYPLLTVRCFDFSERVSPDVYEHAVEFEGMGLQGLTVRATVSFSADTPDINARSVRFAFPVRTDLPFRQRITSVLWSGDAVVQEWSAPQPWISDIDISAPR